MRTVDGWLVCFFMFALTHHKLNYTIDLRVSVLTVCSEYRAVTRLDRWSQMILIELFRMVNG